MADSFGITYDESQRATQQAIADLKEVSATIEGLGNKKLKGADKKVAIDLMSDALRQFIGLGKDVDAISFKQFETQLRAISTILTRDLKLGFERVEQVLEQGLTGTLDATAADFQGRGKEIVRAMNAIVQSVVEAKARLTELRNTEVRTQDVASLAPVFNQITPGNADEFIALGLAQQKYDELLIKGKQNIGEYETALNALRRGAIEVTNVSLNEVAVLKNLVDQEERVRAAVVGRREEQEKLKQQRGVAQFAEGVLRGSPIQGGFDENQANLAIAMGKLKKAFQDIGEPVDNLETLMELYSQRVLEITPENYNLANSLRAVAAAQQAVADKKDLQVRATQVKENIAQDPLFAKITPGTLEDSLKLKAIEKETQELMENGKAPIENYRLAQAQLRAGKVEINAISDVELRKLKALEDQYQATAKAILEKEQALKKDAAEQKRSNDIDRLIGNIRAKAASGSSAFGVVDPNDAPRVIAFERSLLALGKTFKESGKPVKDLTALVDQFEKGQHKATDANFELVSSLNNLQGNTKITAKAAKDMTKAAKDMTIQFSEFARFIEFRLIAQTFFLLSNAFKRNAHEAFLFEKAVREIQTIAQDMPETYSDWSDALINLSNKFNLPLLSVAEAQYQTLSNQVAQGADNFYFMGKAAEFALASVSSIEQSVNLLSSVLKSFSLDVTKTEEESAKLFKAIDLGRFKAGDISDSFGRVAPFAAQLGIKTEELEGALAQLTIVGIPASEAMTQLRNIFTKLIKPTDEMKKLLDSWGVSSGEAAIKAFGFVGVLDRLSTATGDSSSELAELFNNIRGLTGAVTLTRFLDDTKDKITQIGGASEQYKEAIKLNFENAGFIVQQQANIVKNSITGLSEQLIQLAADAETFTEAFTSKKLGLEFNLGDLAAVGAKLALVVSIVSALRFGVSFFAFKILPAMNAQLLIASGNTLGFGRAAAAATLQTNAFAASAARVGSSTAAAGTKMASFKAASTAVGASLLVAAVGLEVFASIMQVISDAKFRKIESGIQDISKALSENLEKEIKSFSDTFKTDFEPAMLTFNSLIASTAARVNKESNNISDAFKRFRKAMLSGNKAAASDLIKEDTNNAKTAEKLLDAQLDAQFDKLSRSLDKKPKSKKRGLLLNFYTEQLAAAKNLLDAGSIELAGKSAKFAEKALDDAFQNSTDSQKAELEQPIEDLNNLKQAIILGNNFDFTQVADSIFGNLPEGKARIQALVALTKEATDSAAKLAEDAQKIFDDKAASPEKLEAALNRIIESIGTAQDLGITIFDDEELQNVVSARDLFEQMLQNKKDMYQLSQLETQQQRLQQQIVEAKDAKEKAQRERAVFGEQFSTKTVDQLREAAGHFGPVDQLLQSAGNLVTNDPLGLGTEQQKETARQLKENAQVFTEGINFIRGDFQSTLIDLQQGLADGDLKKALAAAEKIQTQTGNVLVDKDNSSRIFGAGVASIEAANRNATNAIKEIQSGKLAESIQTEQDSNQFLAKVPEFTSELARTAQILGDAGADISGISPAFTPDRNVALQENINIAREFNNRSQIAIDPVTGQASGFLDIAKAIVTQTEAAQTTRPNIVRTYPDGSTSDGQPPTLQAPVGGDGVPTQQSYISMHDGLRYSYETQQTGRL